MDYLAQGITNNFLIWPSLSFGVLSDHNITDYIRGGAKKGKKVNLDFKLTSKLTFKLTSKLTF